MARINQADADSVPEVLVRFQAALGGLGRIGGPYVKDARKDLYRWEVSSRGDVELLHHLLLPWLGQVKLLEFSSALERAAASSRTVSQVDEWRAWAAGLWDGEGSVYLLDHRTHVGYQIAEACLTQSSTGGAPEVLARFMSVAGVGHINGPYAQKLATMDVYRWKSGARADIRDLLATLWPWLALVKRVQAKRVLGVVRLQPELPRGREEWGRYKSHCIHGHEYATARLRPYVSRGKGIPRRDNQQCLACVREQARKRGEAKNRSTADDDRRSISEPATRYLLK